MADDTNDVGSRTTLALIAPVKVGKKAANKRSDNVPLSIPAYDQAALNDAFKAIGEVGKGMVSLDDASTGLLRTAALHFSAIKPVNAGIWDAHFRDEMKKRYQDTAKLSRIKTAVIAFSNCDHTDAALALIVGHSSLQAFCTSVRPSLVKLGLVKASNAGAETKPGSNKKDAKPSNVVQLHGEPTAGMQLDFKNMARSEAAAVLANPTNEPHGLNKRLQALLLVATSTKERSIELMDLLLDMYPDSDTADPVEMVDLE